MKDPFRIVDHPILGAQEPGKEVTIYFRGEALKAQEGEPIAAALMAKGIRALRTMEGGRGPRGVFCAVGHCTDCMMIVDGQPNVLTCVTPVKDGMRVEIQHGLA